ncbi:MULTISPECIES: TetR/AcrR family transcriptional regulator [Streptomyces]|uniref:TetR family transcriptional regulator n=1 Tax=Streptomyces spororaveus TaxID=284039 RepID=A0ABQ3TBF6_9ACTN|nr:MULTISPECIES: TetR/AcrR family transcriptional regulator [Streptomyces]MCM9081900.1 TetR/AcrR family transcriptional regulator [Streptomyces spororaveus]MCX5303661.1 TetR/AcrR family transcriptional regulator [Streptomyces sp. NBC_00160]GHI77681.1 TetR family transcriptional regulator [Streptomyces spororaveus]
MSAATKEKLLEGALRTLAEQGIAKASARTIATTAGVGQGLIFYHFGSVDELLAAACRFGAEQRVARYRDRLAALGSLTELLEFARAMHEEERAAGNVALLGQLLAAGQSSPVLAAATADGLGLWIEELEKVLTRLLAATPLEGYADPAGLARATAASFIGIELYEGVDPQGAGSALAALEQLAGLAAVLEGLGSLSQRVVRHGLRRGTR